MTSPVASDPRLAGLDAIEIGPDKALRERMTMQSFLRPFHPRYPAFIVEYLARTLLDASPA